MRVDLAPGLQANHLAVETAHLVESCVHCGLCSAVCPTYELLDSELDSPRGRIYLIRELLQGQTISEQTRVHLDACLNCRACETACPSGVRYGQLIDAGQQLINGQQRRTLMQRTARSAIRLTLTTPTLLRGLARLGWGWRRFLPETWRRRIPPRPNAVQWPVTRHERRVLRLVGCVQPVFAPGQDAALAAVLDRFAVSLVDVGSACCGALDQHLDAPERAREWARRNIDAWWPHLEQGVDSILASSSGCAVHLKDYARLLADDPVYAAKARRISEVVGDPAQLIDSLWSGTSLALTDLPAGEEKLAFHVPCSMRNGLQGQQPVETLLRRAGYQLTRVEEQHLCCGSAGAYSILQRDTANQLLVRKLEHLLAGAPVRIASANIGCILHLQSASPISVHHWLELLAQRLPVKGDAHEG